MTRAILLNKICGFAIVVAILNFIIFCCITASIGGVADNAKREVGRYYVSDHGTLTEVSSRVWYYSNIHFISAFITHPLGIFAMARLMSQKHASAPSRNRSAVSRGSV